MTLPLRCDTMSACETDNGHGETSRPWKLAERLLRDCFPRAIGKRKWHAGWTSVAKQPAAGTKPGDRRGELGSKALVGLGANPAWSLRP